MRRATALSLLVLLGCGLTGCYRVARPLHQPPTPPAEEERVTVLVARHRIPMGTLVKEPEKLFMEKQFAKSQVPASAVASYEEVRGKRLNRPLLAEQFVTPGDLLDANAGDLPALLPAGKRAVTVRLDQDLGKGGILPGSYVDVLSLVPDGDGGRVMRVLLKKVRLLAADPPDAARPVTVATLHTTPEQAEQLAMAQGEGELRLVLHLGDEAPLIRPAARLAEPHPPR